MTSENGTPATRVHDLVRRLRERASWLESRSFAELHGTIEREAADTLEALTEGLRRRCKNAISEAERTEAAYEKAGINSIRYMAIGVREQCEEIRKWLNESDS